jgi:N-methylhydantoinase B
MFDRIEHPARGRGGGRDGAPGSVALDDGTPLRGKGVQSVPAGRRLVLRLPGGGGYGEPLRRARAAVAADLAAGYVSKEQARSDYGLERGAGETGEPR